MLAFTCLHQKGGTEAQGRSALASRIRRRCTTERRSAGGRYLQPAHAAIELPHMAVVAGGHVASAPVSTAVEIGTTAWCAVRVVAFASSCDGNAAAVKRLWPTTQMSTLAPLCSGEGLSERTACTTDSLSCNIYHCQRPISTRSATGCDLWPSNLSESCQKTGIPLRCCLCHAKRPAKCRYLLPATRDMSLPPLV